MFPPALGRGLIKTAFPSQKEWVDISVLLRKCKTAHGILTILRNHIQPLKCYGMQINFLSRNIPIKSAAN